MPLTQRLPVLATALVGSAALMGLAAATGARFTSLGAALGFAVIVIETALATNRPIMKDAKAALAGDAEVAIHTSRRNARIMAIIYGWGALAIFVIYAFSDLWWFHSWQYGSAMALIAGVILGFVHLLGDKDSQFRSRRALDISAGLAILQSSAASMGLGFLVASGKLFSQKPDWPANHVFLAGGIALTFVSVIAAMTHFRLRRAEKTAPGAGS